MTENLVNGPKGLGCDVAPDVVTLFQIVSNRLALIENYIKKGEKNGHGTMPEFMMTYQAAAYLKMSARGLAQLCRTKRIQFLRVGKTYRFKKEFLDGYLLANGYDGKR